jgi:signal transduction histidine kinase
MAARIQRLPALSARVLDGLIVAGLCLIFVPEAIAFGDWSRPLIVLDLALGFLTFALLLLRRDEPIVPVVWIPVFFLITGAVDGDLFEDLASPFLALIVALYSLGRYGRGAGSGWALAWALGAVTLFTLFVDTYESSPGQVLWLLVLGLGPYLVGRAMADRTRLRAELLARTEELERDRKTHAGRAVEDERARIAGELQAVIANGVTAMVLGAEAVPRVIAAGDTERAGRTLAVVEETGRDSLAEMRRLLGVLRRDGEGPALAPLPTMAEVDRLLDAEREDDLEVAFAFAGERVQLPAGADLAAYRVLQEALDAAAASGARRADVTVAFGSGELRIEVCDDRPDPAVEPEPLMAMRERLGLYGGRVRAGIDGERGTFSVAARLPVDGAAA